MSEGMNVRGDECLKIGKSANWAPENLLVANWALADWFPWRQIGPLENWDLIVTNTVIRIN